MTRQTSALLFPLLALFFALLFSARHSQASALPAYRGKPVGMNSYILNAVKKMPEGGGYSTSSLAFERLRNEAVRWDSATKKLTLSIDKAQPSFCSAACYLVLLQALKDMETNAPQYRLPASCWEKLAVADPQPDGQGAWGRVNSNGPGLAKWIHDLRAGVNFTDPMLAIPGDFLKIFWTEEIGAREFGHLVVFIAYGRDPKDKTTLCIRFWSANQDAGYGVKTVPASSVKRMIFTRVTNPAAFRNIDKMPDVDEWLASMLKERIPPESVLRKCRVIERKKHP